MAIKVQCESCKQSLSVKDSFAGKTGACPSCGQPIVVPSLSKADEVAPEEPSDAEGKTALPATEKQKGLARQLGISFADDIARGELGRLIGEAKRKVTLYATEKQMDLLRSYGVEIPENLTRDQASTLIDRVFDLSGNLEQGVRQRYDKQMKEQGFLTEYATEHQLMVTLDDRDKPLLILSLDDDEFKNNQNTPIRGKLFLGDLMEEGDAKYLIRFLAKKWASDFDEAEYAEEFDGVLPAVELSIVELDHDWDPE